MTSANLSKEDLIARKKAYVLILQKDEYAQIIGKYMMEERAINFSYISSKKYFKNLPTMTLKAICSGILGKFYDGQTQIHAEGDELKYIYIVKSGKMNSTWRHGHLFTNQWPAGMSKWTKKTLCKEFEIVDEIKDGEIIGFYEFLEGIPRYMTSVTTTEDTYLFAIPKEVFQSLFPDHSVLMEIFEEFRSESLKRRIKLVEAVEAELSFRQKVVTT